MTQTEAMAVLGDLKDPATYPGLENYENVNLTVLTMDAAKVKGRMEIDDQNSLTLSEVKGLVTVTGLLSALKVVRAEEVFCMAIIRYILGNCLG